MLLIERNRLSKGIGYLLHVWYPTRNFEEKRGSCR